MSAIGPQIPAHLLSRNTTQTSNETEHENDGGVYGPELPSLSATSSHGGTSTAIGPQIPARLSEPSSSSHQQRGKQVDQVERLEGEEDDDDDDDDYGPALPPDLLVSRTNQSQPHPAPKRVLGPSLPGHDRVPAGDDHADDSDDDSDESDYGPMPPPARASANENNGVSEGVREFMEREERRRKESEEAAKPKELKRDEWMLVPPSSSDMLSKLSDPLKLKPRTFLQSSNSSASSSRSGPGNLWTETPAERMQRVADEVAGVKRRAVDIDDAAGNAEDRKAEKRRKKAEAEVRKAVEEHNRSSRNKSLIDLHSDVNAKARSSKAKGGVDDESPAIWDHARDMSVGGRLMDDRERGKLIADARALGDRFGRGRSGGFL